jgi:hypothetical protein
MIAIIKVDLHAKITELIRYLEERNNHFLLTSALMKLNAAKNDIQQWMENPSEPKGVTKRKFKPAGADFWFEWHEEVQRLYIIHEPKVSYPAVITDDGVEKQLTVHAEPIAFGIGDHGAAQNAVLVFMRGYNAGRAKLLAEQSQPKD